MAKPRYVRSWLRLPGRLALILGVGALSTAVGRNDAQAGQTASGDALIRSDGEKIYLLEDGRETELQLRATPQRDRLLQLLEEHGPAGIKLNADPRLIMSGGGGAGFSLWDLKKSVTDKEAVPDPQDPPRPTAPTGAPERRPAPRYRSPVTDKKG
jgi:hypothetical protein